MPVKEGSNAVGQFVASFKSTWGAVSAAAAAGPLLVMGAEATPPWPNVSPALAVVVSASALLIAFKRAENASRNKKSAQALSREGTVALVAGVLLVFAYFALYSQFVIHEPQQIPSEQRTLRFVTGFQRLPAIPPADSDLDALRNAQYRPELVWTSTSLTVTRLSTLASFVLGFSAMAYGAALLAKASK